MSHDLSSPHAKRPSQGVARIAVVVVLLAVALVGWGLFSRHQAQAALKTETDAQLSIPVSVIAPKSATAGQTLTLPGNVQANFEAPIYARTDGYLRRWLVDIGTPVKAGQVLAEVEAPDLDQQLYAAQAEVTTAEANAQIAKVGADRWRDLRDSDSVSKQEADERIATAQASDAALKGAQANVQRLRALTRFKQIVAPFDGIVTARSADIGQLIASSSAGEPLFRVADMSRLRIYVRIPQIYAAYAKVGTEAQLKFPDRPGLTYTAKLVSTSSAIDASSRTLLAQLQVDNAKNELLPGAYAEVAFQLPVDTASQTFVVPANALLFRGEGLRVATVGANNRAVLKAVTLGRDFGNEVEVASGLAAGDRVIVSPPDSLTDNAQLRVVTPQAPAQTAPQAKAKS